MLGMLDYLTVLVYGVLLMMFFLDIKVNRKSVFLISLYIFFSGALKYVLYFAFDSEFIEKLYPLIIHMPVIIFFWYFFKKRMNVVLFVLFISYIFTAPRRWFGEVVASFFNDDPYVLVLTKIMVSVILLIITYRFLKPYVNRVLSYSRTHITLLTVVPALSYCITYATTVYTDALYNSNMLVVGLFSVGFNFVFYTFIIAYFIEMDKSFSLQTEQKVLQMQIDNISIQIEDYKAAQEQGAIYRHDLRHHLQYISANISENHTEEALTYIAQINKAVDAIQIKQYCENTSVNLILSTYVTKAKNNHIDIDVDAIIPMESDINSIDVCIILSNALENAINACNKLDDEANKKIRVSCKYEDQNMKIEICNNFEGEIYFEEELPISSEKDHGLGIKSIVATVNKYVGLYAFTNENGIFTMRVIL
jgi:hypothetical protein